MTSAWALAVLPVCFALSGFAGIVYQIGWARQFALVFGTTEVAVTLVLAAYMGGLGLGAPESQALRRLSRGAPIITDDRNRMATVSAGAGSLTLEATDRLLAPFDPLRVPNPAFQRSYMARRLAMLGARDRLGVLASATDPQSQMGYEVNAVRLAADGDSDAAQDMIQQGLARYPQSEDLRYEYIQPWLTRLARGTATKEITAQASKLTHSADAVVSGTVWPPNIAGMSCVASMIHSPRQPGVIPGSSMRYFCRCSGVARVAGNAADEALNLIDQAISAQPAIALYAARVQSALAAKRSNVVVESIWEYGEGLFADASLDRAEVRPALQQMLQVLNRQTGADAAGPAKCDGAWRKTSERCGGSRHHHRRGGAKPMSAYDRLPLNALRVFEAVATRLNFGEAAEALHVTPAAVSQQIKTLEEYLQTPLFRRDGRKVH